MSLWDCHGCREQWEHDPEKEIIKECTWWYEDVLQVCSCKQET